MSYTWPPDPHETADMSGVESRLDTLKDITSRGLSHTEYRTHQHEHVDFDVQTWLDIDDAVMVLHYEFRSNHRLCQPRLEPKWANTPTEFVRVPRVADATGDLRPPDPRWLNNFGGRAALMELTQWAPDGGGDFGEFTVKLDKPPLFCPMGLRIQSTGVSGETTVTSSVLVLGFFS